MIYVILINLAWNLKFWQTPIVQKTSYYQLKWSVPRALLFLFEQVNYFHNQLVKAYKSKKKYLNSNFTLIQNGSSSFVPPPPPPTTLCNAKVTKHAPLQNKSLCKNMSSASGGANNMHPLRWETGGGGGHTRKRPTKLEFPCSVKHKRNFFNIILSFLKRRKF